MGALLIGHRDRARAAFKDFMKQRFQSHIQMAVVTLVKWLTYIVSNPPYFFQAGSSRHKILMVLWPLRSLHFPFLVLFGVKATYAFHNLQMEM